MNAMIHNTLAFRTAPSLRPASERRMDHDTATRPSSAGLLQTRRMLLASSAIVLVSGARQPSSEAAATPVSQVSWDRQGEEAQHDRDE
jgi:hypothetical protein